MTPTVDPSPTADVAHPAGRTGPSEPTEPRPQQQRRPNVTRITTAVRESALSVDEVIQAVTDPGAGGIAVFLGAVRDHDHGRAVTALDYSAHPTAPDQLRHVAEHVAKEFPDAMALAAIHRVGDLGIGDLAVVVAASAPHRAEAFAACRAFIDALKDQVPIWKHETFADGDSSWVGC